MTDLLVRWGKGDFKKWGKPSNGGDDFEMGGDTLLWTIYLKRCSNANYLF